MTETINLMDFLREIEDTTDLNGCFFVNVESYKVIESTIPFHVPEEILWELSVLRDTFQQFGKGFQHGDLQELMIEGDRGYILFYNIPPHLILLAMGGYDINLSYVKLAMIDILKNIREKIFPLGDEILSIPAKGFGKIGMALESSASISTDSIPIVSKPIIEETTISEPIVEEEIKPEPVIEEATIAEPIVEEKIKPEPVIEEATTAEPIVEEEIKPEPVIEEPINFIDQINSIKKKTDDEKYIILNKVFNKLKENLNTLPGNKFSELLEVLKDAILESIGTSLALFDISRTSREVSKINSIMSLNDINKYQDRIENWAKRIVKN